MHWTNRITEAVNVRINNKIAWRLGSAEGVEHLSGQRGEQKWARVQVRRED